MIKKNEKHPLNLFYMSPNNVMVKDLKEVIDKGGKLVQIWEELRVLQIELPNGNTVDFESMKPEFKDPSDGAFIKNRNINSLYAVTVEEEDFNEVKSSLYKIIEELGGFFCTDSDDFKPIYQMEDLKS